MNRFKRQKIVLLGLLLLTISLVYCLISSKLIINGTSWDIHWNNVVVTPGSITGAKVTTAAHILTRNTEVESSITLGTLGEYYEFTVDAVEQLHVW